MGSTVVAMFPNRIDAVIIDSVLNPFEYYYNEYVFMLKLLYKLISNLLTLTC